MHRRALMPHQLHRHALRHPTRLQHRRHCRAQAVKRLTMPHPPPSTCFLPHQPNPMQPHQLCKLVARIAVIPQPRVHPLLPLPSRHCPTQNGLFPSLQTITLLTKLLVLPLVLISCFITRLLNIPPHPQLNKKELITLPKHPHLNTGWGKQITNP